MFHTSVDIANLALQFLGLPRMDPTLGFNEVSQRAQEAQSAYGRIKRAELRRAIFQWAIRKAVLRPLDTNTMIAVPTLWESSTVYFRGSIVVDQNNFQWISNSPNNSTIPGQTDDWAPYFGPLTINRYDSNQIYFAGELVYITPGDGSFNVYQSQVSNNVLDPSLPNIWSSAAIYSQNNVVQTFPAWSSGTTYAAGRSVLYTDGKYYTSLVGSNLNNIPVNTLGSKWVLKPILQIMPSTSQPTPPVTQPQRGFAPLSPVVEWLATQTYALGSFVMFDGKEYVSTANNNTGNQPDSLTNWAAISGGTLWMSLIDMNTNNNPTTASAAWNIGTIYAINALVVGSNGVIYQSLANGNTGNDPTTDLVHWLNTGELGTWTSVFTQGGGNQQWLQIGGDAFPAGIGLEVPNIVYPLGSGPASQQQTRNVFRLPAGYLRSAPQDPKAGSTSWLGSPSGMWYSDWTYEGNYIISRQVSPIIYAFVADIVDVTQFDDMFSAGLAYRLALTLAPILTNSPSITQQVAQQYNVFMKEARIVSGIEIGAIEPAEDDYVIARL